MTREERIVEDLTGALREVLSWIREWNPNFETDDEWPATRARAERAIANARVDPAS